MSITDALLWVGAFVAAGCIGRALRRWRVRYRLRKVEEAEIVRRLRS